MKFLQTILLILPFIILTLAQPPRENARGPTRSRERQAFLPVQPGSAAERTRARTTCDNTFRELNGVCTNSIFNLWGSTNRAQSSLFFTHSSRFPTGRGFPSARFISNALLQQSRDRFNDRDLNELAVFFGQFIDHTFVATPVSNEHMNIKIPEDDPIFGNFTNGELEFRKSRRVRVDLLGLYGSASSALARRIPGVLRGRPDIARAPGVADDVPEQLSPKIATPPPTVRQPRPGRRPRPTPGGARPRPPASDPRAPAGGEGPNFAPSANQLPRFFNNERPENSLTSALDLSSVYGVDEERNSRLRTTGGKLLVDANNLMPLNEAGLNNAPTSSNDFFLAGDHRANEHPVLTSIHTIFVREHNIICDELKKAFPTMSDDDVYENARKINGAQFQKIVFEEWYPAITGRNLPRYTGFRFYRNPAIIDVFSTAAFRVGHTMVGNGVPRRGSGNTALPTLPFSQMFFRTAAQFQAFGDFEDFVRGAIQTNAQEIDLEIQPALRNFLFTGIPEEGVGFDLASLNIQRGRDHALPSYNDIRQRLGLRRARSFADISSRVSVQSALANVYGNVNRVEVWIGLIAEDHVSGSSLGRTMLALWQRQFENLRDGDRFFFRNNIFSKELLDKVPTVGRMFNTAELLTEILARTTDVSKSEVTPKIFFKR